MRPLFPPLVPLTDPQDDIEAMKSYQKEADQGDAVAQFNLGLMYEFGIKGVLPPDGTEAMKWYLKAAQQGNDEALNVLANEYADDKFVSQDDTEAATWYQKAAQKVLSSAKTLSNRFFKQSTATKCPKYLYILSIYPDPRQGGLARAQYFDLIERAGKELGLSGQPRAVVFRNHYDGPEHCHIVWSRIDTEKAVHIAHDRRKLRKVAQEFARDHGLTLPPGMQNMDSEF